MADTKTQHPPRHIPTHDQPTKCPPRQHGDCHMPTRPGAGRAGGG